MAEIRYFVSKVFGPLFLPFVIFLCALATICIVIIVCKRKK